MVFSTVVALSVIAARVLAIPTHAPDTLPGVSFGVPDTIVNHAQSVNYSQNYNDGGANFKYSPNQNSGSFSIQYNTTKDFVVGLGWQPGDRSPISYSGSFSSTGVGLLSIYGWSTNPLIEYYIMETSTGYIKSGTEKGTFTSDGSSYEIWEHWQNLRPTIEGKQGYQQFISIRTNPRTSGIVTVKNHFDAWAKAGLNLGTLNFQILAVESWNGTGEGQLNVKKETS